MKSLLNKSLFAAAALVLAGTMHVNAAPVHVPVVFSGGHDTDPRDRGRPVILVASALGVPPKVFRDAFTHVHPAPAGMRPTEQEAQDNKAALLEALSPYGVTNDRLDTVSNYYRYVRSQGQHWPATPAAAYALVEHGVITGYVVTSGGSGYSSAPGVTVPGITGRAVAVLSFSKSFSANGAVSSIVVVQNKSK
ncbi:MAG: hypothetical protein ACRYFS_19565 [Janthinobacterium lividum]